ncbi:MerR family transcriptional regulator [Streptomonospora sp. PA3]|uniref:MerR family transcriptional regulator n=1 Tax=Streptomonospora sp. PA3 TaxID=2607326 RepID=UPI0012DF6BFD|nr:MerR family transcriptional regulator [Streptomonospora sp. PA3]MUL41452.1 MerR family transcriptional regulator [Streptomonospora sp. PA3]
MRIGELAALVGVSTRTVRHYHRLGLLPEPRRRANGYRDYRLRDAVALARIRRLAELGLSLEEIRDVLADDRGRELREVLGELDADLARQQEAIAARRERLAALLAEAEPDPDATVSPELAAVLRDLPDEGSAFAAFDRQVLSLIDTGVDPGHRAEFLALFRPLTEPDAVERGRDLNRRLDELAGADPGDPRVEELAADLAGHIPAEMASAMVDEYASSQHASDSAGSAGWLDHLLSELPPAQIAAFRRLIEILAERR